MEINDVYKKLEELSPSDFDVIKPKIEEFYNEGENAVDIYYFLSQYIEIKDYVNTLDIKTAKIVDFVKANYKGNFLYVVFNDEEKRKIMKKTLIFEDENICIFKPTNYEESRIISGHICCFDYSEDRWNYHCNECEEEVYYVYNVIREGLDDKFVAITVHPNGGAIVVNMQDKWLSPSESIKYIKELGDGAKVMKSKHGNPIIERK